METSRPWYRWNVPFELELAALYLFSRRGRGHRSRLVRITALGLAFGSLALVVTLSLLAGFQEAIRREIRAAAPGFTVRSEAGDEFPGAAEVAGRLARLESVASAHPRRRALVWAINETNGAAGAVNLIEDGALEGDEIRLDPASSASLSAVIGSRLRIVAPREELSPGGPVPVSRVVRVSGYQAVAPRQRGNLRVSTEVADSLIGDSAANEVVVVAARGVEPDQLRGELEGALSGDAVLIETPDESQRALGAALRLERRVLFAAIALVIVVAASGVAADLSLLAVERRSGAAILRAQGASRLTIRRLYLYVGGLVGFFGGAAGALVGALLAWTLDRTAAIPLPEGLYTIDRLPFSVRVPDVAAAAALTTGFALAAAWFPARRAADEAPAEAIRER